MADLHLVPTQPDPDEEVNRLADEYRSLLLGGWNGNPIEMVLYALLVDAAFKAGWMAHQDVQQADERIRP